MEGLTLYKQATQESQVEFLEGAAKARGRKVQGKQVRQPPTLLPDTQKTSVNSL